MTKQMQLCVVILRKCKEIDRFPHIISTSATIMSIVCVVYSAYKLGSSRMSFTRVMNIKIKCIYIWLLVVNVTTAVVWYNYHST